MDLEQLRHKVSVVFFSGGWCTQDHRIAVFKLVLRNSLPGQETLMCRFDSKVSGIHVRCAVEMI